MASNSQKFRFWCPVSISKAKDDDGDEVMRIGGIASTIDKDSDGEFLDPQGFDIEDFKNLGVVNWHHQAKNSPSTIIGEPYKAEVRKEGFYVETNLYPSSPLAREVYELAQTLKKDSTTRRLGYSIEGTVVERESDDKTAPGYKIIKKAKITGLAITHMPKNPKTFADIIKGNVDEEEMEDKSLDTESGAPLKRESVDGYTVKNLSEEQTYDEIFKSFPGITIEKAEQIYNFINKIKTVMKKGKEIKATDLEKAMQHLGIESNDENPFLEKAKGTSEPKSKSSKESSEDVAEAIANKIENEEWGGDKKVTKDKTEETEGDDGLNDPKEGIVKGFDSSEILKAINASSDKQSTNAKSLAMLIKAQMDDMEIMKARVDRTSRVLKETQEQLQKATQLIKGLSSAPMGRKSITKGYRDKTFVNTEEQLEKAEKTPGTFNAASDKRAIVNMLDSATFAKGGFDEEFSKALTSFEAGNPLSDNVIARLNSEFGIKVQQ